MILTDSFIERYFFKLVTFWVDELCCWIYEWNELLFVVKILILCELSFLRTTWSLELELNWCWRPYISFSFSFSELLLAKKKIWDVIGSPIHASPISLKRSLFDLKISSFSQSLHTVTMISSPAPQLELVVIEIQTPSQYWLSLPTPERITTFHELGITKENLRYLTNMVYIGSPSKWFLIETVLYSSVNW